MHCSILVPAAVLLAVGAVAISSLAQQPGGLAPQIEAARGQFQPVSPTVIEQRRQELQQAMWELEEMLYRSPRGYAEGWKQYLQWESLVANVQAAEPEMAALREVYDQLSRNNAGVQMSRFLKVRDRLRDFLEALAHSQDENLNQEFNATLDRLAERLAAYEQNPTGAAGPEIGSALGWLQNAGQSPQLVAAVQNRYSQPNLYAHASERFMGTGFNTYVNRTTPISDVILGTTIRGTGVFRGTQVLDAVPSAYDGRLNILLRGNVYSNNVGQNGPVTIYNTANTSIYSAKQLVINQNGVFALPAQTSATTDTTIHDIRAKHHIIEHIAWKRARQQEAEAEAIASGRAAGRMNAQVDREALSPVAQANYDFQQRFRQPLLRRGYMPQHMQVHSTADSLGVRMLQMNRDQIAASTLPPAPAAYHDLAVQTHESFVANFSEAAIGGVEITDEALAQMLLENTGRVPEELRITQDSEPWSIRFAERFPIAAAFNGNEIRIFLRANRFTRGRDEEGRVDQEIRALIEISAAYTIEPTESGFRLVRQGEVEVDYVGLQRLSAGQVATKTFLRRKFSSLFKPEIIGEGMQLEGRFARAGRLTPQEVRADAGWLTVGWRQGW
jgi:hypothetical protein